MQAGAMAFGLLHAGQQHVEQHRQGTTGRARQGSWLACNITQSECTYSNGQLAGVAGNGLHASTA